MVKIKVNKEAVQMRLQDILARLNEDSDPLLLPSRLDCAWHEIHGMRTFFEDAELLLTFDGLVDAQIPGRDGHYEIKELLLQALTEVERLQAVRATTAGPVLAAAG
jgi:hypothetical protein